MTKYLIILTSILYLNCSGEKKEQTKNEQTIISHPLYSIKGKKFSDFDIFEGKGLNPLSDTASSFPQITLQTTKDSLFVEFYFDEQIEGHGIIKFKKEQDYFYRIDTLEYDGQKSIYYEYHTKTMTSYFEKYFKDKNNSQFKLKASIWNSFGMVNNYELEMRDTFAIGHAYRLGYLDDITVQKKVLKHDSTHNNRVSQNSIFWQSYLCSGISYSGFGISCEYLD